MSESDKLRLELLDQHCFNEGMEEHIYDLREAIKPFAELVEGTSGRIPVERLAFAHWHQLTKAYGAARNAFGPREESSLKSDFGKAMHLLRSVYAQIGNHRPAEYRHKVTPGVRDEIRDFIKKYGFDPIEAP